MPFRPLYGGSGFRGIITPIPFSPLSLLRKAEASKKAQERKKKISIGKNVEKEKRTDDNQQIKTRVPVLFPEISRKILSFLFLAISKKRQSSQAPPTLFPFLN
jgi:hypothetical protein